MAKLSRRVKVKRIVKGLIGPKKKKVKLIAHNEIKRQMAIANNEFIRKINKGEIKIPNRPIMLRFMLSPHNVLVWNLRVASAYAMEAMGITAASKKKKLIDFMMSHVKRAQHKNMGVDHHEFLANDYYEGVKKIFGGHIKTNIFFMLLHRNMKLLKIWQGIE